MDELKILLFTGNGLIFFLSDYYNNNDKKNNIIAKMDNYHQGASSRFKQISGVLDEYKNLLSFLAVDDGNKNGEDLIHSLDQLFSGMESLEGGFTDKFIKATEEKITAIFKTRLNKKDKSTRSLLACSFYPTSQSFCSSLAQNIQRQMNIDLFTTNYDKISEEIFVSFQKQKNLSMRKFALHGTYDQGNIICHAPNKKAEKINQIPELKKNFESFHRSVVDADVIIIFGNSLAADPHILEKINCFGQEKYVVIIQSSPTEFINYHLERNAKFLTTAKDIFTIQTTAKQKLNKQNFPINTPEKLYRELSEILNKIANV